MADFPGRVLDLDAVKALSHPLRVRIFDRLSEFGPMTATKLGELLGESSGSTSYHLRQLARHGLVREVAGRGTTRERWWERIPGAISLSDAGPNDSPAMHEVLVDVSQQWNELHAQNVRDYLRYAQQKLPEEWTQKAEFSTSNAHLPPEVLAELTRRYHALVAELVDPYRGKQLPGTRPVQIQFSAFALIGGEEVTE